MSLFTLYIQAKDHEAFACHFPLCISRYKIMKDPARWLSVNPDTGLIRVKNGMDRESLYVQDGKYTALIMAYDDGM